MQKAMTEMRASVLIAHHEERCVEAAVGSVQDQTFADRGLIVDAPKRGSSSVSAGGQAQMPFCTASGSSSPRGANAI
jgi:hypothetical protein